MSALTWNETLALQQPQMDQTHREFVGLLGLLERALQDEPQALLQRFDEFLAHTEEHFAQEERWMAALGFATENCHAFQHASVLQVLREVRVRLVEMDDTVPARMMVPALAEWFPMHAQSMDAALAQTMAECGYDPETQTASRPPAADAPAITGCGSASCG